VSGLAPLRITVVAGERRLDLAVPPRLAAAEVVAEAWSRLDLSPVGQEVCALDGAALRPDVAIGDQVMDGAVLCVLPRGEPVAEHDDPAVATAAAVAADREAWQPPWRRVVMTVAGAAAAVLLLLAVVGLVAPGAGIDRCAGVMVVAGVAAVRLAPWAALVAPGSAARDRVRLARSRVLRMRAAATAVQVGAAGALASVPSGVALASCCLILTLLQVVGPFTEAMRAWLAEWLERLAVVAIPPLLMLVLGVPGWWR
jgi:hypothetical protein